MRWPLPCGPGLNIQLSTYDRPCGIRGSERVPTTSPPNQAASGGAPAVRSASEVARTTWPARNRSAPARTPSTRLSRRPPGARPACRCGPCRPSARPWRPGAGQHVGHGAVQGPMRSLGRRCRVRSAARPERVRVALGVCGMKSWVQRVAPASYLVLSRAHQRYGQHQRLRACIGCQEALSEGPAVA
jgi:hypothetical protein